jgi:hypothetical protein
MRNEISCDLVMDDNMSFVEGVYRLPGCDWQVVVVAEFDREVAAPLVVAQRCKSGVCGVAVRFPHTERINAATVERVLSEASGVSEWLRVPGPYSIQLR